MDNLLYTMKLHSELYFDNFKVLRVAGGWLYTYLTLKREYINTVFVPFNNEFQKHNEE